VNTETGNFDEIIMMQGMDKESSRLLLEDYKNREGFFDASSNFVLPGVIDTNVSLNASFEEPEWADKISEQT
jgi:dihydroorotase-like cyclic amidohydrolase